MKKINLCFYFGILLSCVSSPSFALGQVSRACSFAQIDPVRKYVAKEFFKKIGVSPTIADSVYNSSLSEQGYWWTLESLTFDWGQVRYYLFATSKVFVLTGIDAFVYYYTSMRDRNNQLMEYTSAWTAQQITQAMRNDPTFSPYYANREILYSARAGNPGILERFDASTPGTFLVQGKHWFYDDQMKVRTNLPDTQTTNCSLENMGNLSSFGEGILDR